MHDAYAHTPGELVSSLGQAHTAYVDSGDAGRSALARELHDTVIQPLTSLVVSLAGLDHQQPYPGHFEDHLKLWQALAQEALDSLRSSLAGLSSGPQTPRELSLADALRSSMMPQLASRGIRLIVRTDGWPADLPSFWTTEFFLTIREALTNAIKHASASRISVQLRGDPCELTISIADDGVGCCPDVVYSRHSSMSGHGLGIRSIQERIESLGGQIQIHTAPGCGMRIVMRVPRVLSER